jgi:hypothetical protein
MNIEQRLYEVERRCRKLQCTMWVLIVALAFACTLGMTQLGTQDTTIGGFLYPNTIHRVELVHTRDNMGEIGWIRGGVMTAQ